MSSSSPSISADVQALINNCEFLTLTDSHRVFINSKGAGLPLLGVNTAKATAIVAFQGAHLLHFCAANGKPLLWISPNCDFTPGVALRGGIPVCLPWFGPHAQDPKKPKHGFARNRDWQLSEAQLNSQGDAELLFRLVSKANDLFEFNFVAELLMTLGDTIKLEIRISNADQSAFDCSWVLHSYFPVASLADVKVKGLAGRDYLDNLEQHARKQQVGDVNFPCEVDRVYPAVETPVDISGSPEIRITHHNCPSVVVWNPGAANAAKITDIGAGNEQHYICVERGAVLNEKWRLSPGETHSAWMEITESRN